MGTDAKGRIRTKYIDGLINNVKELYIPFVSVDHEYYSSVKIGDEINVLYNPNMTDVIVQGMTLRVLPADVVFNKALLFPLLYLLIIIIPCVVFLASLYRRGPLLFANKSPGIIPKNDLSQRDDATDRMAMTICSEVSAP